ncbi:LysR family transcriptional regulator [Microbacterium capsulatum]|uniref:LysR family transcriptional regulator n=1 Tax=Microbacterium capsulatum TaxID=3041921 RepID=A0ABU0XG64_9MICO|nr:LysR family transcriptional regulator [Microbacterium sp. ASV81]MDQ4214121.1 LysR family transcriptional regulator [Microbacterium sp. ASV81]
MDIRPLRALVQIAADGSISRAALALGVTQQALSARIRAFEREIGVEILHRSPRGTTLTAEGDLVVAWAREALTAMDRFTSAVRSLQHHAETDLVVAASQTVAAHLLPGWVVALHRRQLARGQQPTPVVLDTANSDEVLRKVHDGECAVGFIEAPRAPGDLGSRAVHWDRMIVAVGVEHPWAGRGTVGFAEVSETPLVVRENGSGTRAALERALTAAGFPIATPAAVLSTEAAIRSAVIAGIGPAVLSELAVADDAALGRLRTLELDPVPLRRPITALWRGGDRDLHGLARELVDVASSPAADQRA